MMEIKLTPRTREILVSIENADKNLKTGIEQALKDIMPDVEKEVKRLIKNTAKTGRVYPVRGGYYRASAPGEAPASRTGRLLRSTNYGVRNWQEAYIGESELHALFMEKGTRKTRRHGGIAPRPHLITAINNRMGYTYTRLEQAHDKAI